MLDLKATAETLNAVISMFGESFTVTPNPFNPLTDTERSATITPGGPFCGIRIRIDRG